MKNAEGTPVSSAHAIQQLHETRITAQRREVGVVLDPRAMAPAEIDGALEQIERARVIAELRVRAAGVVEEVRLVLARLQCRLGPCDGFVALAALGE